MSAEWRRFAALLDDDPEVGAALDETDDPRESLVDALDDAGALAYMEWSDSGPELADALAQLPRVFRTGTDTDEIGDLSGTLEAAIARADAVLAPHNLRVLYIDEGTDACPLLVVAASAVAEIVPLARKLGVGVRVFG